MLKNDVLRRIESLMDQFSKSQKKIANFILAKPQDVIRMTVMDLAKVSDSSPTTVMRFCQTIHVDSFPTLKVEIASSLTQEKDIHLEIKEDAPLELIKKKLLESSYQTMQDTMYLVSDEILSKAKKIIEKAEVLFTFGSGASYLVAENIAQKWNRIGKLVICSQNTHILTTTMTSCTKKAVLIVVSNSGETKEAILMQKMAKRNNISVISITSFGNNTLSHNADVAIQTARAIESEFRSAATSSLHAQFITIDLLFFYFVSNKTDDIIEKIKRTKENINLLNKD